MPTVVIRPALTPWFGSKARPIYQNWTLVAALLTNAPPMPLPLRRPGERLQRRRGLFAVASDVVDIQLRSVRDLVVGLWLDRVANA